jgi:hypothetical protein
MAAARSSRKVDIIAGLEPVLPMSCLVEWTGQNHAPAELYAVESVEDQNLSTMILQRDIRARWDGKSLSWERDGELRPGKYVWRVAVHDAANVVLASSEEKIGVDYPRHAPVAVSSLILGKSCRDESQLQTGLQKRSPPGTKVVPNGAEEQKSTSPIDPMRVNDCRLKPESTDRFAATDMLHAFVRIYPGEKFAKDKADSWTAKFVLRSQSGSVETERDLPFTVDSGSGFLASIELPLNAPEISEGQHTFDVQINGPGIHKDLKESRSISIVAGATRR